MIIATGAASVSIPSRGFWFFEDNWPIFSRYLDDLFQSPRGDFGFLKAEWLKLGQEIGEIKVSIPSRGFWFFEPISHRSRSGAGRSGGFQSPRGDFGFLKLDHVCTAKNCST